MNKTVNRFSRIIAVLLIITVSFMFFSCSVIEEPPPQEPSPLTPGVGTPRYFYVDSDGNYIENEVVGSGRTGLIVEDNPFAEGVLVYSDDTGIEDKVAFAYEDSIVSMSFKKGSNFPNSMNINVDSKEYYAYISKYNAINHTYHVTFISDSEFEMMDNIVLNENIFSLYEHDPELSDSQNRRMANMIVAMGVWGSLYATFDKQLNGTSSIVFNRGIWGSLSNIFKGVSKAFSYIAVAATVVAVVVAPIVMFINPIAGIMLYELAKKTAIVSTEISILTGVLADYFEEKEKNSVKLPFIPLIYVSRVEPDGSETKIKYNDNKTHEEFHILAGEELIVKFYIPGLNSLNSYKMPAWKEMVWFDEPGAVFPDEVVNVHFFTNFPPIMTSDENNKEVFFVKFKRKTISGYGGDGKINFGFIFNFLNEKTGNLFDLTVNDYTGGFNFRLPPEYESKIYKNMVVIHFCMKDNCPDIH